MSHRFAAVVVRLRIAIVVGWVVVTAVFAFALPTVDEAQTGRVGDLVPTGAEAIDAEERVAELFALPLASRTMVVERDPRGLSAERIAMTGRRISQVNQNALPGLREAGGAYGVSNSIPGLSFARERGTTNVSYLLFPLEMSLTKRKRLAGEYAESLGAPPSSYVGVTGAVPARRTQALIIFDYLKRVELVTVAFIALIVALYARSLVAPVVTLVTVVVAFLVAIRLLAAAGQLAEISIPSEVEPVAVALLFGVVTDYALFYMSRFRRRLAEGADGREAALTTAGELTPIVLACGLAVAAGCGALAIAEIGFLRAFGPGMALMILVALVVALTLLPAILALLGERLFWPSKPHRGPRRLGGRSRTVRVISASVRHPVRVGGVALLGLGVMMAGLAWLEVGNPIIRGLPADHQTRVAYKQLSEGFAPGVSAPITIVVEGPGIVRRRAPLRRLQSVLGDQPGIAGVVGPATNPADRVLGAVLSRTGDAARFVLIPQTDPLGATAVRRLGNLRVRMDGLLEVVGLPGARASFAGDTALVQETLDLVGADFLRIAPAVLLAIALVLAVFLRSLVAPLYLLALAVLAPAASLGLAVAFFQGLLGLPEISYFVPIVTTVLLVSLGSDYNVFLAGRIWADAREMPLREAIVSGGTGAARAISAAGVVLAGSFAALALVPVIVFAELAFVLAAGLLIDAFLVRGVLAPAVIAFVGERSAWPRRFRD